METLTLPTVPAYVTDAREDFQFTVTPAVLAEAQRVSPFRQPEACLRKLGHDMAEVRREAFRAGVHPDLPDSWVRSEVELWRGQTYLDVTVRVALVVELPELLGVWVAEPGKPPRLASNVPPAPLRVVEYCTVDGRPVYGQAGVLVSRP